MNREDIRRLGEAIKDPKNQWTDEGRKDAATAFSQTMRKVERNPALYSFTSPDQVHNGEVVFCTEGEFPLDMILHVLAINRDTGMVEVQTGEKPTDKASIHFSHLASFTRLSSAAIFAEPEEPFDEE
jgi:hypothetical protein